MNPRSNQMQQSELVPTKVRKKGKKRFIFCQRGRNLKHNFLLDKIEALSETQNRSTSLLQFIAPRLGPIQPDRILTLAPSPAITGRRCCEWPRRVAEGNYINKHTDTTVCLLWGQKKTFKAGNREGDLGGSSKPHLSL